VSTKLLDVRGKNIGDICEVALKIPFRFRERVTSKLFEHCVSDYQSDHSFSYDARGWNGTNIRSLVVGLGSFTGGNINCLQSFWNGADRFHRRAHSDDFAVTHATLNATGSIRESARYSSISDNFIVSCRSSASGGFEAIADLNTLDGLDAHKCCG
jgi:hypothetical protein